MYRVIFTSFSSHSADPDMYGHQRIGQNLDMISVSKLCCPVCWEFLSLLRGEDSKMVLSVRGCHSIIYPVRLPAWLPEDIVKKMVKRFQTHLRHELNVMMSHMVAPQPPTTVPRHHRNTESESNISVTSSLSGQTPQFNENFQIASQWAKDME